MYSFVLWCEHPSESTALSPEPDHTAAVRLNPRRPPPAHYYAANLLTVVRTVLRRYDDILSAEERDFGCRIEALSDAAQRLLARLIGRAKPLLREDSLAYPEVADVEAALVELASQGLIERSPVAPLSDLLDQLTVDELRATFWEVAVKSKTNKASLCAHIEARNPACVARWRMRRSRPWLRLRTERLALYQLLFFGGRGKDMTTFVMRDLGVHRFEPVPLSRQTRQFADRASLESYLGLLAAQDEIAALGNRPDPQANGGVVAELLERLWAPLDNRFLERRRSRALNRLGRNLERVRDFDAALACYRRSTLAPARERRMRILHRLEDADGAESVRAAILAQPQTTLEADFASRFACSFRRKPVPTVELPLLGAPASIEAHALNVLTAQGGTGWHLENHLPMAVFGLAYWHWMFTPIEGAFVNAFQTAPVDLFWPDFFATRAAVCADPLRQPLKPRLRAVAGAKVGVANRLFSWRHCSPEVIEAVLEAIPEADLLALAEIVREDLPGKRAGFPDLTVLYGPGEYEFVEVKGPGDRLQIHQRLWIQALQERGLPVRVLRFRLAS